LIASRYLTEARASGLPPDREAMGCFLLGRSLIESGQFEDGVSTLRAVVENQSSSSEGPSQTLVLTSLSLLADTCLILPSPKPDAALQYNSALLASPALPAQQRTAAVLQRAECLSRLAKYDEARQALAPIQADTASAASIQLWSGAFDLDEAENALEKLAPSDRRQAAAAMSDKIARALAALQKAIEIDQHNGEVSRQASYHILRALVLKGDSDAALKQALRVRQLYSDSLEELAATLVEADVLRDKGEYDSALLAYRRVLQSFAEIPVYRSHVLSIERIREHSMAALNDFVEHERYGEALAMLDHFTPLFSNTEQLELRGTVLERWGNELISRAPQSLDASPDRSTGLKYLRAAGGVFEQLAELRFATKFYSTDLWRGAEDYFQGQSFSRAVQALQKYLKYEPELRNAQALLRLGQAQLALGNVPESIAALEECIEFHPLDNSTFQARIDCAKAYWNRGDIDRSEALLRDNIAGSSLKPLSPEWKDSLFELGMLLHEKEKFEEAIGTLEEAVERYPDDPQRLVAQYVIGESYRRWAHDLLDESQKSRATSERDRLANLAIQRLNTALAQFEDVQRTITLRTHDIHSDPLMGTMLRNCYMLEGTVLFDLGRYKEAIEAYSNVSSLYPDEPFVLETFVQIANCWRRLNRHDNARGAVKQAQIVLERLPPSSNFASTTMLNREEWRLLLGNMSKW
jgi:tetratricopeptide (TPR) repeat protein